jgi:hypothetical protein
MALGHVRHQTVGETMQSAGATSLHEKEITGACWAEAFLSCSAMMIYLDCKEWEIVFRFSGWAGVGH